jgi:signal transduction histidine kinase/ActR/RegA family two-component response regulator
MRRESEFGLLAPLVGLALGAMAVFVASLLIWANQVDRDVRRQEEDLVRRGLTARIHEIERSILSESNWDEAVVNLDNRFNYAWAEANLNDHLAQDIKFEQLFVLDGDNRPIYARRGQGAVAASAFDKFTGAQPLIAEVRRAEARRGPIVPRPSGGPRLLVTSAIQATDFAMHDGAVYLVTATLVQPDLGAATPDGPFAPIVVTALRMEASALTRLQGQFALDDLKAGVGGRALRGQAAVTLPVAGGDQPLVLSWTPHTPGADLARSAALPIAVVLLAFGVVGLVMIARIRRAAAQFMASHRTQTQFLANVSHEIRTPLNGVNAIAAALGRTPLSAAQAEMVGIIQGSGETLERVLSDVLDVSHMETGVVKVELQPFHLGDTIRSVAGLAAARTHDKGLDLILDIDPAAEAAVTGDAVRVKQILTNLVSNAVKFTSDGYVAIAVRPEDQGRWRIDVQDTGVGFDPADKDRLFSRFQQGDGSTTRAYGGTGLGLTICKQLVELMGGEIDATAAPGEGATFSVRLPLPLTAATPLARPEADVDAAPDRPLRILLADDHPTNRKVVELLFSQFDIDLVCAENGREACEVFAVQRFDLVLMDMQMPVMDGLTAVRAIRERERQRSFERTPIVMLTANALPEHREASLAAGADLHMTKPIEASKLFGVLQSVAERQDVAAAA